MQNNLVETLVGAAVIVLVVGFVIYGYSISDVTPRDGYTVNANFDRVDGVTVGSDVRMSGIKIGTVASQELNSNTYSAKLALFIRTDIRLPEDTSAKVAAEGLLGGNYIALTAGGSETMLADGDEISYTQGTVDLLSLVGQALFNPQNNATDSQ